MEIIIGIGFWVIVAFFLVRVFFPKDVDRSQKLSPPTNNKHRMVGLRPARRAKQSKLNHPKTKIDHAPPPDIPASRQLRGRAFVIDGDTIVVSKIKIRLAGIDAPELDQPWGQKSKWAMVGICKGQTIRVELTGETSYDRLVGTCYLSDGRDIGAEIVKAGLALDGSYFSQGKYKHLEDPEMRRKLQSYGHWRQKA